MKNLFLVINKEKIYAYIVSIMTIVTLFFMTSIMTSDFDETESTSSNVIENKIENNVIENKVENNVIKSKIENSVK